MQFIEFSLEFACTSPQAYYCRVQPNVSVHIHFVLSMKPCMSLSVGRYGTLCRVMEHHYWSGDAANTAAWTLDWSVDWTGLWTGPWTGLDYGLDSWRPFTWPINWLMHRPLRVLTEPTVTVDQSMTGLRSNHCNLYALDRLRGWLCRRAIVQNSEHWRQGSKSCVIIH